MAPTTAVLLCLFGFAAASDESCALQVHSVKGDADLDVDQDPAAAAAPAQDPMKAMEKFLPNETKTVDADVTPEVLIGTGVDNGAFSVTKVIFKDSQINMKNIMDMMNSMQMPGMAGMAPAGLQLEAAEADSELAADSSQWFRRWRRNSHQDEATSHEDTSKEEEAGSTETAQPTEEIEGGAESSQTTQPPQPHRHGWAPFGRMRDAMQNMKTKMETARERMQKKMKAVRERMQVVAAKMRARLEKMRARWQEILVEMQNQTSQCVELGLRAKVRYFPENEANLFFENGTTYGPFGIDGEQGCKCPYGGEEAYACWNWEWSINTNYCEEGDLVLSDLTYEMCVYREETSEMDRFCFDPINLDPGLVADHSMGDNTFAHGAGVVAATPEQYEEFINKYSIAQNTANTGFFSAYGNVNENVTVNGTYFVSLSASKEITSLFTGRNSTVPVTSQVIQVIQNAETGCSAT